MDSGGDVFSTFRWGVRKYAWVVVLFTIALGVVFPALESQHKNVYESEALVSYQGELKITNTDVLPRAGASIFGNGAVADEVRRTLGLPPSASVIPSRVELVAEQDNVVFTVIGRDADPKMAQQLADSAAAVFAQQLSNTELADSFIPTGPATLPATPVPSLTGGTLALILAPLAGAIVGLGVVLLLLMWRQPVLDAATAREASGVPVLGHVRLPHRRSASGSVSGEVPGLARLARRLLATDANLVLLTSPDNVAAERTRLVTALTDVLSRARSVRVLHGGELDPAEVNGMSARRPRKARAGRDHPGRELVVVDAPTQADRVGWLDGVTTLLVVPEGIRLSALRAAVEEHLDGPDAGVVLVSRDRRRRHGRTAKDGDSRSEPDYVASADESDDDRSFFDPLPDPGDEQEGAAAVEGESHSPVR